MATLAVCAAMILAACGLGARRVRSSEGWRATVTPLASIIGSGFLVLAPLLAATVGSWAPVAMTGIVMLAYADRGNRALQHRAQREGPQLRASAAGHRRRRIGCAHPSGPRVHDLCRLLPPLARFFPAASRRTRRRAARSPGHHRGPCRDRDHRMVPRSPWNRGVRDSRGGHQARGHRGVAGRLGRLRGDAPCRRDRRLLTTPDQGRHSDRRAPPRRHAPRGAGLRDLAVPRPVLQPRGQDPHHAPRAGHQRRHLRRVLHPHRSPLRALGRWSAGDVDHRGQRVTSHRCSRPSSWSRPSPASSRRPQPTPRVAAR